ncbi:hypothetical protein GCM10019059_42660 [Camelimonas fluminis]|uniref:Uncharacterized protein n=2 Tax=Camelimonas fluminis TaxID=1576911 RepID=A0ABV7UJX8_9HYPH|nr:hypothetical protein GCM10019059_42660 [Camelimonas fluminis]
MRLFGMTFATAAGSAAFAAAPDGLQATTLAAVVYLNGMRIHADNCRNPLEGGTNAPLDRLKAALNVHTVKRDLALREWVDDIYQQMRATAPTECMPQMYEAYAEDFARKLGELKDKPAP